MVRLKIAIAGTRGIPARYGGFETFAEELSKRLVERGHEVAVYCRPGNADVSSAERAGRPRSQRIVLPALRHKYFETVSHTLLSALDALRRELASRLELADAETLAFAFVTDYPLFEWSETEGRWMSAHHPFTSPNMEDLPLMDSDPGEVRSHAYDLVCNGWELFSGSIRIHRREVQEQVFKMLGIDERTRGV